MTEQEHDVSWALKLLEREPELEENLISKYFSSIYMGLIAGTAPAVANATFKRPIWAGIQSHIVFAIGGVGLGYLMQQRSKNNAAERDAKLRDYIIRHPEDFPPPVRVKYANVFAEWVPIR